MNPSRLEDKERQSMEAVKIIVPAAERKPCVCGATLYMSRAPSRGPSTDVWLCSRHCGARGLTYAGALRRKIRLDYSAGAIFGAPAKH